VQVKKGPRESKSTDTEEKKLTKHKQEKKAEKKDEKHIP